MNTNARFSLSGLFLLTPRLFLLLVVVLLGLGNQVCAQVIVAGAGVSQTRQSTVTVKIKTNSSPVYGAACVAVFYNAQDEAIGGVDSAVYGTNVTFSSLPIPPVAQRSRLIHHVVVYNNTPGFWLTAEVEVTSNPEGDLNAAGTGTGEALTIGQSSSVSGSLAYMDNGHPEKYQYYRVFLDHKQKLLVNGWARSETLHRGASLLADIQSDPDGAGSGFVGVAPYGTASFQGSFENQGEPANFWVRVYSGAWKVAKYKMHFSVIDLKPDSDLGGSAGCSDGPCDEDKVGPSKSFPVRLANGREESRFPSDLEVYNPVGDSVVWKREWNETSSLALIASPGFSPGWTHNYDYWLNSSGHHALQLHFPSGAVNQLSRKLDAQGNGTGELTVPAGSPYFARGQAGTDSQADPESKHDWQWVEIVWNNGSIWRFEPKDDYVLRLSRITNETGQSLSLSYLAPPPLNTAPSVNTPPDPQAPVAEIPWRDERHRLSSVQNDKGATLLTLEYRPDDRRLVAATDGYGRRISYGWANPPGLDYPCLSSVSQIKSTTQTTSPVRDIYSYVAFGVPPLLKTITRPHPNGDAVGVTAENFYDDQGRVISTRDAHGNTRNYSYNAYPRATQVQIEVRSSANVLVSRWTKFMDEGGRDIGSANASGHRSWQFYEDAVNPARVTRVRDPLNREARIEYDAFGNVTKTISPRGVVTVSTYAYGAWRFGRLVGVQTSAPGISLPATTITYYEPSGLVASVTGPHPNGGGTVTSQYTYDSYGNVVSMTTPGVGTTPGDTALRTTVFSYILDGSTNFAMKVGRPVAVQDSLGHLSHLRYDARGNLVNASDALGNTTMTSYDLDDSPVRVELPATGQSGPYRGEVRYGYAYRGGPLLRTQTYDENRIPYRTLTTQYGPEGEVLGSVGDAKSQSVVYDALYRMTQFRDGAGHATHYQYDLDGYLREVRYPLANTQTGRDIEQFTSYDEAGALLQKIDGRGVVSNFVYNDPEGQLSSIAYPASPGENVALQYDALGRVLSRTDGAGVQSVAYNSVGTLQSTSTTYRRANGSALAAWAQGYSYNANGSRASLTTPLGTSHYGYDAAGRWTGLADWAGATSTWNYDNGDRLIGSTSPLGVKTNFAYNGLGQLIAQEQVGSAFVGGSGGSAGEVLAKWGDPSSAASRLLYSPGGQLQRQVVATTARYALGGTTTFGNDFRSQIDKELSTRGLGYAHGFDFDDAGNPTIWKGRTRTFNADNQETTVGSGGLSFAYDGDGNATRWLHRSLVSTPNASGPNTVSEEEKAFGFSYSAQGQMRQVNELNADGTAGELKQKNGFRSDGLRAWKENKDGYRTYFFYDGEQLLGTVGEAADGEMSPPMQLMWGADGLLGQRWKDAQNIERASYFLWDTQGNLALSYTEAGALSSGLAYTAWGTPLPKSDGTFGDTTFGYGGKFGYMRDAETGLVLCTYRFYDPSTGTWTQRDPISYSGGSNLYGYVSGDPSNATDPSGLYAQIRHVKAQGTDFLFITLPIRFFGNGATARGKAWVSRQIEQMWTGKFGKHHVFMNVVEIDCTGRDSNQRGYEKWNSVTLHRFSPRKDKPVSNTHGIFNFREKTYGDPSLYADIYLDQLSNNRAGTFSHEAGHMMGLGEGYYDLPNGATHPLTGFNGNVMGGSIDGSRTRVGEQNIVGILSSNSNTIRKE